MTRWLPKIGRGGVGLLLGTLIGVGGVAAAIAYAVRPVRVAGVQLQERDLDPTLANLVARRQVETVRLHAPDGAVVLETTWGALGAFIDGEMTRASLPSRRGAAGVRLWVREPKGPEVDVAWRLHDAPLSRELQRVANKVYRAPIDAALDLESHARRPDVPGAELDFSRASDVVLEGLRAGRSDVTLPLRAVRARVSLEDFSAIDPARVLASFESDFETYGTGAGRAVNIRTAAGKLDGTLLHPGETLSFNDVVGPRTLRQGFTYAPEIVGDELETGVGGGTCQVASTLHAAAVFGGLDVVQRSPHGRAPKYIKLGLDATVAYGLVDLKIKNPWPAPVVIHAYLPKPSRVRVELLGWESDTQISYGVSFKPTGDFFRRITYKSTMPAGTMKRRQKGERGMTVYSFITQKRPDGTMSKRAYASEYSPVPEVYWVGSGFDEGTLPGLPDGATHVEYKNKSTQGATSSTGNNGTSTTSYAASAASPSASP
jgi:vancomycin resistance protein YoaR